MRVQVTISEPRKAIHLIDQEICNAHVFRFVIAIESRESEALTKPVSHCFKRGFLRGIESFIGLFDEGPHVQNVEYQKDFGWGLLW